MERLRVIVDRSRWYRGKGSVESRLRRSVDGQMCCLGFACLAAGHSEDDITEAATPLELRSSLLPGTEEYRAARKRLDDGHGTAIGEAININDSRHITDEERERDLARILTQVGIDLEFVDGPVEP